MKELIEVGKVFAVWTVLQLAWAGIGLAVVETQNLNPTNFQIYAFVSLPYLVALVLVFADTFRKGK